MDSRLTNGAYVIGLSLLTSVSIALIVIIIEPTAVFSLREYTELTFTKVGGVSSMSKRAIMSVVLSSSDGEPRS